MSNPRPYRRLGLLSTSFALQACLLAGCNAIRPPHAASLGRLELPAPEPKLPDTSPALTDAPATIPILSSEPNPDANPSPTTTRLLDEALSLAKAETAAIVSEVAPKPEPTAVETPPPPPDASPPQEAPPKPATETPPAPPPPTPEESWRNHLRALRELALAKSATEGEPGVDWKLRERLLAWMLEPDIDPDATSPNEKTPWRSLLLGLGFLSEPRRFSPPEASSIIRSAIEALEQEAPLEIQELKLCRKVNGFGDFEPIETKELKAGGTVVIYRELVGVRPEPVEKGMRTRIASQVEVLPEGGTAPVWSGSLGSAEDVCGKRRRDYYVNSRFTIPPSLNPGDYRLRLIETDLVAKNTAGREISFRIASPKQ